MKHLPHVFVCFCCKWMTNYLATDYTTPSKSESIDDFSHLCQQIPKECASVGIELLPYSHGMMFHDVSVGFNSTRQVVLVQVKV